MFSHNFIRSWSRKFSNMLVNEVFQSAKLFKSLKCRKLCATLLTTNISSKTTFPISFNPFRMESRRSLRHSRVRDRVSSEIISDSPPVTIHAKFLLFSGDKKNERRWLHVWEQGTVKNIFEIVTNVTCTISRSALPKTIHNSVFDCEWRWVTLTCRCNGSAYLPTRYILGLPPWERFISTIYFRHQLLSRT